MNQYRFEGKGLSIRQPWASQSRSPARTLRIGPGGRTTVARLRFTPAAGSTANGCMSCRGQLEAVKSDL